MRLKLLSFTILFFLFGFAHAFAQQADPAGFIDPTQQQKAPQKKKAKKVRRKIHWFWQKRSINDMSQSQVNQTFKKSKRNIREENQTYRAHYRSTRKQQKSYSHRKRKSQQKEKSSNGHSKRKLKWG
jgi:hypothetical protein